MNKPFVPKSPHTPPSMIVPWIELYNAWSMLAAPDKVDCIQETLDTVKQFAQAGQIKKAVFTMVAATAWLTDDGPGSKNDWEASASPGGSA